MNSLALSGVVFDVGRLAIAEKSRAKAPRRKGKEHFVDLQNFAT
jgi:hypothetical protein